jgi:hypothetical protein
MGKREIHCYMHMGNPRTTYLGTGGFVGDWNPNRTKSNHAGTSTNAAAVDAEIPQIQAGPRKRLGRRARPSRLHSKEAGCARAARRIDEQRGGGLDGVRGYLPCDTSFSFTD